MLRWPTPKPVLERPPHLVEIWCRAPTDLFHERVPIKVEKLVGDPLADLRHLVCVPDGVKINLDITIPRGMAVLVFSDGTYLKLEGRGQRVQVPGGLDA